MISLLSLSFWVNFLIFIGAIILSFTIPGLVLLSRYTLSLFQKIVLSTVLGMVLWGWQGFIFGFLSLRFFSFIYLCLFFAMFIVLQIKYGMVHLQSLTHRLMQSIKKPDYRLLLLFVCGMGIQLAPVWGYGLTYSKGVFLCCGNREDFMLHVGLTQAIVSHFPPIEPGMSGVVVHNYHYWSNLVLAELIRVYSLPSFSTEYQYAPLFISLLFGCTLVVMAQLLNISKRFMYWLLFLLYCAGDAIYILLLISTHSLSQLAKVSSLEDASQFLVNPPRAFSLVVAIAGFAFLVHWQKNKIKISLLLAVFLLASTTGFKVYTGIFAGIGLSFLLCYYLLKRQFTSIPLILLFYPLAGIIYLSDNSQSGGLFFAPFSIVNNFIVQPAFHLERLELARLVYVQHHSTLRVLQYEILFFLIFILSMCGIKLVAFVQPIQSIKRMGTEIAIVLISGLCGSLFLGLFFLQESGGANAFNFLVSFWLFITFFSALSLDYWQTKVPAFLTGLFIILVIAVTIPRIVQNTYLNISDYSKLDYLTVSNGMLDSFRFIKTQTPSDSVFIIDPSLGFDVYTTFVTAFVQRPMYLSGEKELEAHQIDTAKRKQIKKIIFRSSDALLVSKYIQKTQIDYLYLWDNDKLNATETAAFTSTVYHAHTIRIVHVHKNALRLFLQKNGVVQSK